MTDYEEFLKTKSRLSESVGVDVDKEDLNPNLFEFQKDIVKWALKKGKAAIFADCGLGKTIMQLEWLNQIHKKINKPVLILAPLAVSEQTKNEGLKFGIDVNIVKFLLTSIPSTIPFSIFSRQFEAILLSGSSFLVYI